MSPRVPKQIKHLSKSLNNASWSNFLHLLHLVSESNQIPGAQRVIELLQSDRIREAMDMADSMSLQQYDDAARHFAANQFAQLLRKYPYPEEKNPFEPDVEALNKFCEAEIQCLATNEFLVNTFHPQFISDMRSFISYVIGVEPDIDSIMNNCDFGPGANVGVSGNATNISQKIEKRWSVSPSAFTIGLSAVSCNFQLVEMLLTRGNGYFCADPAELFQKYSEKCDLVTYNKIAFVPKTAKTSRSIAVEPLINSFVQKGVDTYMRRLLLRVGLDLSDQTKNSEWARIGSLEDCDDNFVTIDLSSASDSISIELCRAILPPSWFSLLDQIRSKNYMLDNVVRRYQKFCSMGNGFCFPLETLIFASACVAAGAGRPGHDFVVYGDDIIIRKRHAQTLIDMLQVIGFTVNTRKSFVSGPFRESCGRDWFGGEDVRPFILDYALDSMQNIFKTLNLTRRNRRTTQFFAESRSFLMSLLPPELLFVRPCEGPPDTAITVEQDEFMSSIHARWDRTHLYWTWRELQSEPRVDSAWQGYARAGEILKLAVLRGSNSKKPFTFRRMTSTRVSRVGHPCRHECVYGAWR